MTRTYKDFADAIDLYTNKIDLKRATRETNRKGLRGLVGKIVFGKAAWQEALTYFAILQSIVIFTALIPDAIGNVNDAFLLIGLPLQFPVSVSSLASLLFIIFIFIFGFVGYRKLRTPAISQGFGNKNNSAMFMIWDELQEIKDQLEKVKI